MLKFAHSFDSRLEAVGNLLKISCPIIHAQHIDAKKLRVHVDHVWWDGYSLKMYAEIVPLKTYYTPSEDYTLKYRELR